jgi:hypothetical protein
VFLERDKFPWAEGERAAEELGEEEVRMLLMGIDFFASHRCIIPSLLMGSI